jgi:zeaxanthin glucosyltransferase
VKFLLITFSDRGHLNPMIALAQCLEEQGDDVHFVSVQSDVTAACRNAGLRARCTCLGAAAIVGEQGAGRSVRLAQRLANRAWLTRWLRAIHLEALPVQVPALRALIGEVGPDAVIVNAMTYSAAVAAELERVPWASVAPSLSSITLDGIETPHTTALRAFAPERDAAVQSAGASLAFHGSDVVSPWLNVIFAYPELIGKSSEAFAVGPAIPRHARNDADFPFSRLPSDRPLVYVAFGSHLSPGPEVYRAVVDALGSDEAFFVVVVKDLMADPFVSSLPGHVLPVEFAPQLELLERADVMVSHGGANSTMECLSRGKPSLVVPLAYEQPLIAALVERAGVGIAVPPAAATAERFREALLALLAPDSPARRNAAAVAARGLDGAGRAAALLRELVESGSPMKPAL